MPMPSEPRIPAEPTPEELSAYRDHERDSAAQARVADPKVHDPAATPPGMAMGAGGLDRQCSGGPAADRRGHPESAPPSGSDRDDQFVQHEQRRPGLRSRHPEPARRRCSARVARRVYAAERLADEWSDHEWRDRRGSNQWRAPPGSGYRQDILCNEWQDAGDGPVDRLTVGVPQ